MSKKGIMVCGHGSRDKDAEREFGRVAAGLKERFPSIPVEYGFLEFSAPNIHMGLNDLIKQGVDEIYAVPGMLFAATHAKNDIPSVLTTFEEKNPGLKVSYGSELGLHDAMIDAFQARIYESLGLDPENPPENLYDTMLVVVGRGTSDTGANAEAAKLTRIVNENMGFWLGRYRLFRSHLSIRRCRFGKTAETGLQASGCRPLLPLYRAFNQANLRLC